jgi:hypothetical protein
MCLSHEHVGYKIPAKINTYMLTRAELLIHLCYEIPCIRVYKKPFNIRFNKKSISLGGARTHEKEQEIE